MNSQKKCIVNSEEMIEYLVKLQSAARLGLILAGTQGCKWGNIISRWASVGRSKVLWIKSVANNISEKEGVILSKNFLTAAIVLVFTMVIVGYSSKPEAAKQKGQAPANQTQAAIYLINYGPADIHAGKVFNIQPDGESAIWAHTQNATPTTVLVLNGVQLNSIVKNNGTLVTAIVPAPLYKKAGEYPLYLLDRKSNKRSNEFKFVVKP